MTGDSSSNSMAQTSKMQECGGKTIDKRTGSVNTSSNPTVFVKLCRRNTNGELPCERRVEDFEAETFFGEET